jgi:hypothetical protein
VIGREVAYGTTAFAASLDPRARWKSIRAHAYQITVSIQVVHRGAYASGTRHASSSRALTPIRSLPIPSDVDIRFQTFDGAKARDIRARQLCIESTRRHTEMLRQRRWTMTGSGPRRHEDGTRSSDRPYLIIEAGAISRSPDRPAS